MASYPHGWPLNLLNALGNTNFANAGPRATNPPPAINEAAVMNALMAYIHASSQLQQMLRMAAQVAGLPIHRVSSYFLTFSLTS